MARTWKRLYFGRRNPPLPAQEFPARWKQHAQLGGQFPDLLRRHVRVMYGVVNQASGLQQPEPHSYDGVGMLWLGSPEQLDRPNDDPNVTPTMRRDELDVFQRPVYDAAMVVEETPIVDGPLTGVALLHCVKLRPGTAPADFTAACQALAPQLAQLPAVRRCASGIVVRPPTIDFDGLVEFWFDSVEAALALAHDPVFRLDSLIDAQASPLYLVEICHQRLSPSP
jgi:hypothetical protein